MNLALHITEQLETVRAGGRYNYQVVTMILETVRDLIGKGQLTNPELRPQSATENEVEHSVVVRDEQTPERVVVANWKLGVCKRCNRNGVDDGDTIVKIHGKGWWHDACFRIARPAFYVGLD